MDYDVNPFRIENTLIYEFYNQKQLVHRFLLEMKDIEDIEEGTCVQK